MNASNESYSSAFVGEERSRESALQVSESNATASAVSSVPRALYSSVNAELLRMVLSSGHIAPRASALPTAESMDSGLTAEMMEMYGSQRNELSLLNIASQLSGNNSTTTQLPTAEHLLYAEAMRIATLRRTGRYPSPAPRTIPSIEQQLRLLIQEQQAQQTLAVAASNIAASASRNASYNLADPSPAARTIPSIEQQLRLLIQEQQAQQALAVAASNIAASASASASRNASYNLADPRMTQSLPLEYLQLLTQQQEQQKQQQQQQRQKQQTLLDTLVQAQARIQAANSSFGDRARDLPAPTPSSTVPTATPIAVPAPFGRYGKLELFPGKLYRLLAEAERDGNTHIVSFTPDGRSFKIHDPGTFIKALSSKYFRHSLLSSFVRQLNFYGFDRLSHGPDLGAFSHPYFIRGRPELLDKIERQNVTRAKKVVR
jgi:hypothetical protein